MGKTRPSKNEILRRNLPLFVCVKSIPACVYGYNCRYSIPHFPLMNGERNRGNCGHIAKFKKVSPKPVLIVPLFEE